jgi:hypothetical protein
MNLNNMYMAWKGESNDQGIYFSSFDGHTWAAQQKVQGVFTSVGPSLAALYNVGPLVGNLYMAWKGIQGDQQMYFSSFDGTNWAPQQKIYGIATSSRPSLGAFGSLLYMAWKGESNDQSIYYNYMDSSNGNWTAQQRVGGVGTSVGPSLSAATLGPNPMTLLYMAWKGESNDQNIYYNTLLSPLGSNWTAQQRVVGVGTSNGPSLSSPGAGGGESSTGGTGAPYCAP